MARGIKTKLLWSNPEYRKHMSEAHKGKPQTLESNLKRKEYRGEKHSCWKGGKQHRNGYIFSYCPNHPKALTNVVAEHRLVVEKMIGRNLHTWEIVHHINEVKDDNRPENLMCLKSRKAHVCIHKTPHRLNQKDIIFDGSKIA